MSDDKALLLVLDLRKKEEDKAVDMLTALYEYYVKHPDAMSKEYVDLVEKKKEKTETVVCDYLSGMTDQYSMKKFQELFIPKSWEVY